jgi:hypothetical protein
MKATTFLSVRMSESENRRVKVLAARLGLSLQDVVRQALDAWVLEHDAQARRRREPQAGTVAAANGQRPKREAAKQVPLDKLRAGSRLLRRPPAPGGLVARDDRFVQGSDVRSAPHVAAAGRAAAKTTAPAPGARPRNLDWLRDAERLDWSKCPVVKVRATQAGRMVLSRNSCCAPGGAARFHERLLPARSSCAPCRAYCGTGKSRCGIRLSGALAQECLEVMALLRSVA